MLATQGEAWKRQWKAEGRAEGEAKGKVDFLLRQLRRRFTVLPDHIEHLVRSADGDRLNEWSERILDARTLNDLFDSGRM